MDLTVTSVPLQEAVDMFARKVAVGSPRTSAQWEQVAAEIRQRAMFSARVESERLLEEMRVRLQQRLELAKEQGGTFMDRGLFIEQMRSELHATGYRRPDDVRKGSLRDMKSTRRLGLIFDMNVAQAQGYAKWLTSMDPDMLDAAPAQELVRVRPRMERRDWPVIWQQSGGAFFAGPHPDYPLAPGRMIALKTDRIWWRISRFGTPWPPYDWGSGMAPRDIRRAEAERLGLIAPGQRPQPLKQPFNAGVKASLAGIPQDGRKRLASALLGIAVIAGDEIRMIDPENPEDAAPPEEIATPEEGGAG